MTQANTLTHANIVKAVYAIALESFRAPKDIKEAARYAAENDRFWSSAIDDVTSQATKFVEGRTDYDGLLDALAYTLEEVGGKMVDYYTNSWNFAPGYKVPKGVSFPEEVSESALKKFAKLFPDVEAARKTEIKVYEDRQQARKAAIIAKVTPKQITALAEKIDLHWDRNFGPKTLADITKRPDHWDMPQASGASEQALLAELMKGLTIKTVGKMSGECLVLEWATSFPKRAKRLEDVSQACCWDTGVAKRVARESKNLSRYIK